MKDLGIFVLAGALIIVGVLQYVKDPVNVQVVSEDGEVQVVERNVGAAAGPEHTERQLFKASYMSGGNTNVATTANAYTLKNAELVHSSVISITAASDNKAAVLALTLPASSTWTGIQNTGDSQTWIIDNLHTAAATTTTVTAGTGVDIDGDTANDDVINGGVSGTMTCWRLATSDIRCTVSEKVDAG